MDPAGKPKDPATDDLERLTPRERGRTLARALPAEELPNLEQLDDADAEDVMRWLETGEGNPWRESSG